MSPETQDFLLHKKIKKTKCELSHPRHKTINQLILVDDQITF